MSHQPLEHRHGAYVISDDVARLQIDAIHAYLGASYWAVGIPKDVVERAVRGSLCLGAYDAAGAQVGLARFVTDFATFCYICDVYVLEEHRGRGLAKAMLAMATDHPRLQGLRRWNLVTRDAHELYTPFGFTPIAHPDRYMEKLIPNVYVRPDEEDE
jgi:GNAT superfamily N-acetyltransferase